ncbi:hypothetical protein DSECCO2_626970 [anaerobic digester metagenome]
MPYRIQPARRGHPPEGPVRQGGGLRHARRRHHRPRQPLRRRLFLQYLQAVRHKAHHRLRSLRGQRPHGQDLGTGPRAPPPGAAGARQRRLPQPGQAGVPRLSARLSLQAARGPGPAAPIFGRHHRPFRLPGRAGAARAHAQRHGRRHPHRPRLRGHLPRQLLSGIAVQRPEGTGRTEREAAGTGRPHRAAPGGHQRLPLSGSQRRGSPRRAPVHPDPGQGGRRAPHALRDQGAVLQVAGGNGKGVRPRAGRRGQHRAHRRAMRGKVRIRQVRLSRVCPARGHDPGGRVPPPLARRAEAPPGTPPQPRHHRPRPVLEAP